MLFLVPIVVAALFAIGVLLRRSSPDARTVLAGYEGQFVRLGVGDGGRVISAFSGRLREVGDELVVLDDWEVDTAPDSLKAIQGRSAEPYCPRIGDVRWVEAQGVRTRF